MDNFVTIEKFKEQVWNIEGIKIDVKPKEGQQCRLVLAYAFDRLSGCSTVDDLKQRLYYCLNYVPTFVVNINE